MVRQRIFGLALTIATILGSTALIWAAVPPPPVNQDLYIYDTSFQNFTVETCLECHGTHPELVILHHSLINSTVPAVSCINASGTVPATLATGCHAVTGSAGGFVVEAPRDCFTCHSTSPHHNPTTPAANQDCQACHGSAVDNPLDGHYIPTYPINTAAGGVTPGPVGRTVAGTTPGTTIIVQGCAACHQPDPAATPRAIFSNMDLHHGTGIGQGGPNSIGTCQWCHGTGADSFTIRGCEVCHGVNSLHNIQADSPNSANLGSILPGQEDLGYGHIGNNWDCTGCHWSWTGSSAGDITTATVPAIKSLSRKMVTVGKAATLTINGNSFINDNTTGTTTYTPVVTLSRGSDTVIKLTPFSSTVSEIQVNLPTTLQQGLYDLRVEKSGTISNLATLVVAPEVLIKSAVLSSKTLTITGTGFGTAPSGEFASRLGVFTNGTLAKTVSWSNNKIVATSPAFSAGTTVRLNTLFGEVSGNISAVTKKVR